MRTIGWPPGKELLVLALLSASCSRAPRAPLVRPSMDQASWQALHQALAAERAAQPAVPWSAGLRMTLREPRSGRTVDGRGAIAVAPGRALRMILVGPAGMTMLDAWVTPERWRIRIPPTGLLRRGEASAPVELPVAFLRWLFFRPLEGALFGGSREAGSTLFLLRDGDAVIEVHIGTCDRGELVVTTRRARARAERLEECRAADAPTPGDRVRYQDETTGLRVELAFESLAREPPSAEAFVDPDGAGTTDPRRRAAAGIEVQP
jgi:hypothetical protein